MENTILPAMVVFAILLAIALYGLFRSNAAAERLNGSRRMPGDPPRGEDAFRRREETRL